MNRELLSRKFVKAVPCFYAQRAERKTIVSQSAAGGESCKTGFFFLPDRRKIICALAQFKVDVPLYFQQQNPPPNPLPLPPQQKSRRIIHRQLLPPQPHPSLPPKNPLPHPPPQQQSRIINQIIEEQPPLLFPSHPHPQFVAAKSLMFKSSNILITMYHMWAACMCFALF